MFGPLRPHVANFDLTGEALIARVHREAVGGIPDPRTTNLLDEVLATGATGAGARPTSRAPPPPSSRSTSSRTTSTSATSRLVTTVGTPQDVTLQEIRVELFFPA